MRKIRAAVVGTGFMGSVHARSIRTLGAELVAVVGSTPERGRSAASAFGATLAPASVEEALAAGIDVLHVCTPNALHAPFAELALNAGVAVVCEKPLSVDLGTAVRLTELAERAGVVATVPFVYRYYASVREARARIQAPEAAAPWLLHGSYLQDWMADPGVTNWRVDPALGGRSRAFADIGVHWCDLAEFVTGQRITRVQALLGRSTESRPDASGTDAPVATEDGAVVSFTTDTGAIGSLVVSQASAGRKNALSFSFDGPDASYAFQQEVPETLWIGGREVNQSLTRDPGRSSVPGFVAPGRNPLPAGHPQGYYECFADFIAATYAAIQGRSDDTLPRFADGLRAAQLTEAVLTSVETGQWQDLPFNTPLETS